MQKLQWKHRGSAKCEQQNVKKEMADGGLALSNQNIFVQLKENAKKTNQKNNVKVTQNLVECIANTGATEKNQNPKMPVRIRAPTVFFALSS